VRPDKFSFASLIACFKNCGQWSRALEMTHAMRSDGVQLDAFTAASLISAAERGGAWEQAMETFLRMQSTGELPARASRVTRRALWVALRARWVRLRARWVTLRARWVTLRARWVTLRARCVTLTARWVTLRARWVMFTGVTADLAVYNTTIHACAGAGEWTHAWGLFEHLSLAGLEPERTTYNVLLDALWTGGQVKLAVAFLRQAMGKGHFLQPSMSLASQVSS
jgi:pentatricopeptide repeat protein